MPLFEKLNSTLKNREGGASFGGTYEQEQTSNPRGKNNYLTQIIY